MSGKLDSAADGESWKAQIYTAERGFRRRHHRGECGSCQTEIFTNNAGQFECRQCGTAITVEASEGWPFKTPEDLARQRMEQRGGVYYVRSGKFVKIGMAVSIVLRLKEFERMNPHSVRVIAWEPLTGAFMSDRERRLHDQFAHIRHRGEWFHLTPELEQHIAQHATRWVDES